MSVQKSTDPLACAKYTRAEAALSSIPKRYDAAPNRRDQILAALQEDGFTSVNDLVARLRVSGMTIRRDLKRLEEMGKVRVVHGGASLPHGTLRSTFVARAEANATGKRRIARAASRMIDNHDTVALDAGTTAYEVAVTLPEDFTGLLVTHSVPAIQLLLGRPEVRVICLGGELLTASHAFIGPMTVEAADRLRVRTFFLGAAALDHRGVYAEADAERPTKLALMGIADEVVLLADHTKFTTSAPVLLCPLDRIHTVITDEQPAADVARALRAAGTRVLVADESFDS